MTALLNDEAARELTELDKARLRVFDPEGWTDGLFDRNFANHMEELGLLEYSNSAMHGERAYTITAAGRRVLLLKEPTS